MWCWRRIKKVRWTNHEKIKENFTEFRKKNNIETVRRRKDTWVGHILRRNCILQHAIQGQIEVTEKIGRYKQLLDDLEENRAVKFERGNVRSHLRRTCLRRSYVPVTWRTV